MSLIYLICLTVFGVFSTIFLFVLIFATKKTLGLFITLLVFSALTALFYRLYNKKTKRERLLLIENLENEKNQWLAYERENLEAVTVYSKEIDSILMNYYHFEKSYRPQLFISSYMDLKLHKEGKSANAAAKIIYDEVVSDGDDKNPEIFNITYARSNPPKFPNFNKIFFGSYNPSLKKQVAMWAIYIVLGLTFYGTPQMLFGPNHDLFVATKEWKSVATPLTWASTCVALYFLFQSREPKQRLLKSYGRVGGLIGQIVIIPVVFFLLYFALHIGAGKLLNEAFGNEQITPLVVVKDIDTRKRSGRYGYTDAYCVKINAPNTSKLTDEYCIQKEHYDQIPSGKPIMMKFHGTKSYFGFRIDGYYEGYLNMDDVMRDPKRLFLLNNPKATSRP